MREKILQFYKQHVGEQFHMDEVADILGIYSGKELNSYFDEFQALVKEGALINSGEGLYKAAVTVKKEGFEGIYKGYRKNYGFVLATDGKGDIYIAEENRNGAMNDDRVAVRLLDKGSTFRKREGRILKVLERANTTVVGTFERQKKFGFVTPDDERLGADIYIPLEASLEARSSAKVLVEITSWPDGVHKAEGKIIEVLGYEGDEGLDINCIMAEHKIPFAFPPEVEKAADALDMTVVPGNGRIDYRQLETITIDGEDAKDLDDAISLQVLENGHYELGVHIADVSHYVESGGIIDEEAYKRGTSVYLVDRVIPMLPKVLSNGICSLNAGEDRYAMSCVMEIDKEGTVLNKTISPSIIHVDRRCNYREVFKALTEEVIPEDLLPFMPLLRHLEKLAEILRAMRYRRGALDFDFPEYKILLDHSGKPLQIVQRDRTIAERMIEEAMLIANETVATYLAKTGNPSVYRIHELPKEEKLKALQVVVNYLGGMARFGEDVSPRELQAFLETVKDSEVETIAQMMTLRAMQQARYSTINMGHFGLASECYTHFTSPIRRYPDLMIHRLIKKTMNWSDGYRKRDGAEDYLVKAAAHSSIQEQVAVKAERDTDDLKKAQYMLPFVGQVFEAKVNSLTPFGMFVEIDNGIDGLVHINTMEDDDYFFNEEQFLMVGRRTGKVYHLGEKVTVTLAKVDVSRHEIDFILGEITDINELSRKLLRAQTKKKDSSKDKKKARLSSPKLKGKGKHKASRRKAQRRLDSRSKKRKKRRGL